MKKGGAEQLNINHSAPKEAMNKKVAKTEKASFKENGNLKIVNPHPAGLDLHKEEIWACASSGEKFEIKHFRTETAALREMIEWLKARGVTSVAMESTGVYWVAPFRMLSETGIEALLVNAREVKSVSGRPKTDKNDCKWICRLHAHGLLRGSFIPELHVAELRTVWSHRERVTAENARCIQRMHKALQSMNIRLDIAVCDITGESGMRIINAILSGERNPRRLALLGDERLKKSREEIIRALDGTYSESCLWVLRELKEQYMFNLKQISEANEEIVRMLNKFPERASVEKLPPKVKNYREDYLGIKEPLRPLFFRLFGADMSQLPGVGPTVLFNFLATVGTKVDAWATEKHFRSWLGLSPNPQISAGHAKKGRRKKVKNLLTIALKAASMSVQRTDTFLGACHRRLKLRLGASKAKTAIAGKIATILYKAIKGGSEVVRYDAESYAIRYKEKKLKQLERQAKSMGYKLDPVSAE